MLLSNLSIATMVDGYGLIEKGAVAIEKGVIKSVDPTLPNVMQWIAVAGSSPLASLIATPTSFTAATAPLNLSNA